MKFPEVDGNPFVPLLGLTVSPLARRELVSAICRLGYRDDLAAIAEAEVTGVRQLAPWQIAVRATLEGIPADQVPAIAPPDGERFAEVLAEALVMCHHVVTFTEVMRIVSEHFGIQHLKEAHGLFEVLRRCDHVGTKTGALGSAVANFELALSLYVASNPEIASEARL